MRKFRDIHVYRAHLECVHLKIKRYKCNTCGYESYKKDNIKKHMTKKQCHVGSFDTINNTFYTLAEVEKAVEDKFFHMFS